jgi:hypothetical protein
VLPSVTHPSIPARRLVALAMPDDFGDRIEVSVAGTVFEDGCGNGMWCEVCLEEIRQEALAWIRELNTPREPWADSAPIVRRITGDL